MENLIKLFHWLVYAHITLVALFGIGGILWIIRQFQNARNARKWNKLPTVPLGGPPLFSDSPEKKLQDDYTKSMGEFAKEMVKELKGRRKADRPWESKDEHEETG